MALEQLEGIANNAYTLQETLTWETATDWDNAVSESGVVHENVTNTDHTDDTILKKGYSAQNPLFSTNLKGAWFFQEDSGSTLHEVTGGSVDGTLDAGTLGDSALMGTSGVRFDGSGETGTIPYDSSWYTVDGRDHTILTWVKVLTVPSGDSSHVYSTDNSTCTIWYDGSILRAHATDSGGTLHYGDTSWSANTGQWYLLGHRYRESDTTINSVIDTSISGDLTQSTSRSDNNYDLIVGGSATGNHGLDVVMGGIWVWHEFLSSSNIQTFYDVLRTQGNLTTTTKSLSTARGPDLTDLVYSLNGESVTIDVIGSPGTASEEIVSQTLDGATSYSLTWSSTHQDFRVRSDISNANDEATPTIDSISLTG